MPKGPVMEIQSYQADMPGKTTLPCITLDVKNGKTTVAMYYARC